MKKKLILVLVALCCLWVVFALPSLAAETEYGDWEYIDQIPIYYDESKGYGYLEIDVSAYDFEQYRLDFGWSSDNLRVMYRFHDYYGNLVPMPDTANMTDLVIIQIQDYFLSDPNDWYTVTLLGRNPLSYEQGYDDGYSSSETKWEAHLDQVEDEWSDRMDEALSNAAYDKEQALYDQQVALEEEKALALEQAALEKEQALEEAAAAFEAEKPLIFADGVAQGREEGLEAGAELGYQNGYQAGVSATGIISEGTNNIMDGFLKAFREVLDVNVLGYSLSKVFGAIALVIIVVAVLWVLGKKL